MLPLKNICLFIEIHFVVLFQVEITFPLFLIPGCNMQHKNDIFLFFARDACILSGWSCLLQPAGGAALSQGRLGGGRHAGQNGQYRYNTFISLTAVLWVRYDFFRIRILLFSCFRIRHKFFSYILDINFTFVFLPCECVRLPVPTHYNEIEAF